MSLSNSAENNLLLLLFQNTNWANIGDATGLRGSTTAGIFGVSLHTANPDETGDQSTSETAYTNYVRQTVARASGAGGWTVSTNTADNASAITYPQCGASGATLTHAVIGRASAGAGESIFYGALTASLAVSNGITPEFAVGALDATLD